VERGVRLKVAVAAAEAVAAVVVVAAVVLVIARAVRPVTSSVSSTHDEGVPASRQTRVRTGVSAQVTLPRHYRLESACQEGV
jgi:hypothetical protein